jgi:hypothetical protein
MRGALASGRRLRWLRLAALASLGAVAALSPERSRAGDAPEAARLVAVDIDDDDRDGAPDGQQATVAGDAARDAIALPFDPGGEPVLAEPASAARLLAGGRSVPWGSIARRGRPLALQGLSPGRLALSAGARRATIGLIEVRLLDGADGRIDPVTGGVEVARFAPSRLADDPLQPSGENTFRAVLIGDPADLGGQLVVSSLGADGAQRDRLEPGALREVPCPAGVGAGLACRSTVPLRVAIDATDRAHPVAQGRSIEGELGGAVELLLRGTRLLSVRVVGPRAGEVPAVERLRARLRVFLVRDRARGAPPFGTSEQGAVALARAQVARANAVWGQCGVSFGPPAEAEIRLVDPPGPSLLAVGCDLGLPASGGQLAVRVDGREVSVPLRPGDGARAVARRVAGALESRGFSAIVSDNLRIGPGADATSDVLVRRRDGKPARLEAPTSGRVSSDPTLTACIGSVDFSDGLQHFSDVDAVAGTVEERSLLKAFDDGDGRTIEVLFVPSFATGGRIGESFIRGDRSSLGNMLIEDRAGVRADAVSFAMAHELGHVLLDVPGHSDDFGVDTPSRLMDSDAADPSAFGPRRLVTAECARAVRQSGPASPTPLLSAWRLTPLPREKASGARRGRAAAALVAR